MKLRLFFLSITALFAFTPVFVYARIPNDPFAKQWGYEETGAYRAWDNAIGSRDVVVAIIDNGFDQLHPDLRENAWKNEDEIAGNLIDDDKNGYVDDVWGWNFVVEDANGDGDIDEEEERGNNDPRPDADGLSPDAADGTIHHGTMVAGIIGAYGNNKTDGAGVNWRARLMNVKIVDNGGEGNLEKFGAAIRYAVDNGADVINLSLVARVLPDDLPGAIQYAYDKGVAVVAAAGNNGFLLNDDPSFYPVCVDTVLAVNAVLGVSAMGRDRRLAPFSNVGSDCVDITAPGVDIESTLRFSPSNGLTKRFGGNKSGTSFAAPFVSAAAALVKSLQPGWGVAQIYDAILKTVHHTQGQNEEVYANLFGAGLVQFDKAVAYAISQLPAGEIESIAALRNRVVSISLLGALNIHEPGTKEYEEKTLSAVKGVSDAGSYLDDGSRIFVTTQRLSDTRSRVSFYSSEWAFIRSWDVPGIGAAEIGIADVTGDAQKEIVVAPAYPSKELFRVFDLHGKELKRVDAGGTHNGASIGFVTGAGATSRVAVLYNVGKGLSVAEFDENFVLSKDMPVSFPGNRGVLGVGDIDGDGEEEFVVGAREDAVPNLGYFDRSGASKRTFFAYDPSYVGGVDVGLLDADGDGKDDVVVSPRSGGEPVRIWNDRSKKIEEWQAFKTAPQNMRILVY